MQESILFQEVQYPIDRLSDFEVSLNKLEYRSNGLLVTDKESSHTALEITAECRNIRDEIDALRKKLIEPAKRYISHVNETASCIAEKLQEIEKKSIAELNVYMEMLKFQQERAQKSTDNYIETLGLDVTVSLPSIPQIKSSAASMSERTKWTFEIEDVALIPREYFMVNEKLIQKLINAGISQIPGIKIKEEKKIVLRRK